MGGESEILKNGKKPHAIIFPLFSQGHINPCVHLAIKLASKGIIVTFVHFEHIHQLISNSDRYQSNKGPDEDDIFFEARKSGLDMRYSTISDGFPLDFDRFANQDVYWESMFREFPGLVDRFVGKLIEESDPSMEHFLVADTFFEWTAAVAEKYNIVNVSFWTQPATAFALCYYKDLLRKNGHFPITDKEKQDIKYIPGIESISTNDLPSYFYDPETTTVNKIVFRAFREVHKSDFILCNTVQELEHKILKSLNQNHLPTYAIGPINFSANHNATNVSKSLLSEIDCTEWLDSKPAGSVLYVSFGSVVQTSEELMKEIAHGILLSEVNFIWVIRPDIANSIEMPFEFKGDIKEKGLVISWCDQKAVLSNSAVGGFLTHCGWNSIVESMWYGVPMICYPVLYDQPANRKLVVDDWKIGVNLCEDASVTRNEVAMKIKRLMRGETSDGIKHETKEVQNILHNALLEDGSSSKSFEKFLMDLRDKIHAKIEETIFINHS